MKGEIFLIEHIVAVEMKEVDGLASFPSRVLDHSLIQWRLITISAPTF